MAKRNKFDVDEELDRHLDFSRLKRALVYIKPHRTMMIVAFAMSALASIMGLLSPKFLQVAIDEAMPNKDMKQLLFLAALTLITIIISASLSGIRGVIMSKMGQNIIFKIRADLFEHLQKLPFSYYDSRPHGKILVRVVNYVNNVSNTLTNGIINAVIDILNIVFITVFMFLLNAQIALLVLIGLPYFSLSFSLSKTLKEKLTLFQITKTLTLPPIHAKT